MAEEFTRYGDPYTVADLMRSDHLSSGRVLAGERGLGRRVTTVTVLTSPDPRQWLKGGEFVLTNGLVLREMPDGLVTMINLLILSGCSGLGVKTGRYVQSIPEAAIRLADRLGFPLIEVPSEMTWGQAVGDFVEQIRGRDAAVRMRLINACLSEYPTRPLRGLRALTAGMNEAFGVSFAVLDRDSQVLASVPAILEAPAGGTMAGAENVRLEPVNSSDGLLGYVVAQTATPTGFPPNFDVLWGFAKLLAANELTLLTFRQDLALSRARTLRGFIGSQNAALSPQEFGLSPGEPVRVVAAGPLEEAPEPPAAIETYAAIEDLEDATCGPAAIVGDTLVAIARLSPRGDLESALNRDYGLPEQRSIRFGVSQETKAEYIGQAVREALSALSVARAMSKECLRTVFYEEIGLMSLMLEHVTAEHLAALFEDTLGKLKSTGPSWPELLMTLEVYLKTDGSASETAKRLHIHPSTLKYRLQRIKSAIPFSTFEDKIRVYAALNLHRLSGGGKGQG